MNEEEIEAWYEEEKEKLDEKFLKGLKSKKNHDKVKAEYGKKLKKLIKEYENKYSLLWKKEKFDNKVVKPIKVFNKNLEREITKFMEMFREE
jgi:hypothetical protein